MKKVSFFFLAVATGLYACNKSASTSDSVSLTASTTTAAVGETVTVTAATNVNSVSWTVTPSGSAKVAYTTTTEKTNYISF
ncbi:MAG: hypothetical protein KGO82_20705, partial [Bacteroidota bacterium]|nr:hypothetical protein [Bacteroidota bacterium]